MFNDSNKYSSFRAKAEPLQLTPALRPGLIAGILNWALALMDVIQKKLPI